MHVQHVAFGFKSRPAMANEFSFSGHETFPFRTAWLKKAVEEVKADCNVFRSDEAIAIFGVGKNMVRSIRHWGFATGILQEHPDERYAVAVTPLGEYLFAENGKDEFCEDPATLWLLHWQLCKNPNPATLWHYVFGFWRGGALEFEKLLPNLQAWVGQSDALLPSTSTVKRDFRCLVNTYVHSVKKGQSLEDTLACPLSSLGLMQERNGLLYFQQQHRTPLGAGILAVAILDYWNRFAPERAALSIDDAIHRAGSPGQIFLLSDGVALDLLLQIETSSSPWFRYQDSEGIRQLVLDGERPQLTTVLDAHFAQSEPVGAVEEITA